MEDLTRNCPGVWTYNEFPGITPQHVAIGKEESNQGVVAAEVLCDDEGNPHGGSRVASRVESARDSKRNANNTNPNIG
jgi:hypothetical protein